MVVAVVYTANSFTDVVVLIESVKTKQKGEKKEGE